MVGRRSMEDSTLVIPLKDRENWALVGRDGEIMYRGSVGELLKRMRIIERNEGWKPELKKEAL
jgi:hypothetical protein